MCKSEYTNFIVSQSTNIELVINYDNKLFKKLIGYSTSILNFWHVQY